LLAFDPKDRPTAEEVCYVLLYSLHWNVYRLLLRLSFSFGQMMYRNL
jgi:hypothetical protein